MNPLSCVLLVDDDSTTNYLNQLLLKRLGVAQQVLVAQDGQQALELVARHCETDDTNCPALILLDLNMPGMDGLAFLAAYEQLPQAQQTSVIIVLTSSMHPLHMQQVQAFAVGGFISKPLTAEKMQTILQQHFGG